MDLSKLPDDVIRNIRSYIYIEPEFWGEYKEQLDSGKYIRHHFERYYTDYLDILYRRRYKMINILSMSNPNYFDDDSTCYLKKILYSYHNRDTIRKLCLERYNTSVWGLTAYKLCDFIKWYNYRYD